MCAYLTPEEKKRNKEKLRKQFEEDEKTWVYYEPDFWNKLKVFIKNSDKIIDLGCGGGDLVIKLKKEYGCNDITTVDFDDYRKEGARNFPFLKVDLSMEKIPINDSAADVIFAIQVLEHLENPLHFIRECSRVLKGNGLFIMAIPNGWNFFSRLMFLLEGNIEGYHKPNHDHISFLPKNTFSRLFKDFETLDSIYPQRKRGIFFPFRHFNFPYPRSEFFSHKACYFLRKRKV